MIFKLFTVNLFIFSQLSAMNDTFSGTKLPFESISTDIEYYESSERFSRNPDKFKSLKAEIKQLLDNGDETRANILLDEKIPHPLAHFLKGQIFEKQERFLEAEYHYSSAANYPPAELKLADMYLEKDKGVPKDEQRAEFFLRKSAQVQQISYNDINALPFFCFLPALKRLIAFYEEKRDKFALTPYAEILACIKQSNEDENERSLFKAGILNANQNKIERALTFFQAGKSDRNRSATLFYKANEYYKNKDLASTIDCLTEVVNIKDRRNKFKKQAEQFLPAIIDCANSPGSLKSAINSLLSNDTIEGNIEKAIALSEQMCQCLANAQEVISYYESPIYKKFKSLLTIKDERLQSLISFHLGKIAYSAFFQGDEDARQEAISYFDKFKDYPIGQLYLGNLYSSFFDSQEKLTIASDYFGSIVNNTDSESEHYQAAICGLQDLTDKNNQKALCYLIAYYVNDSINRQDEIHQMIKRLEVETFNEFYTTKAFDLLTHYNRSNTDLHRDIVTYLSHVIQAKNQRQDYKKKIIQYITEISQEKKEFELDLFNILMNYKKRLSDAIPLLDTVFEIVKNHQKYPHLKSQIEQAMAFLVNNAHSNVKIALNLAAFYKQGIAGLVGKNEVKALRYYEEAAKQGDSEASYFCAKHCKAQHDYDKALTYFQDILRSALTKYESEKQKTIIQDIESIMQEETKLEYSVYETFAESSLTIERFFDYIRTHIIDADEVDAKLIERTRQKLHALSKNYPRATYELGNIEYGMALEEKEYKSMIKCLEQASIYMTKAFDAGYQNDSDKIFFYDTQYKLGLHYHFVGDYKNACNHLGKAAESGMLNAIFLLGKTLFEQGCALKNDQFIDEGLKIFKHIAEESSLTIIYLADHFDANDQLHQSISKIDIEAWLQAALKREEKTPNHRFFSIIELCEKLQVPIEQNKVLMHETDSDYVKGLNLYTKKDYAGAASYFEQAIAGDIRARAYAGLCYLNDIQTEKSIDTGLNHLATFLTQMQPEKVLDEEFGLITKKVINALKDCKANESMNSLVIRMGFALRQYDCNKNPLLLKNIEEIFSHFNERFKNSNDIDFDAFSRFDKQIGWQEKLSDLAQRVPQIGAEYAQFLSAALKKPNFKFKESTDELLKIVIDLAIKSLSKSKNKTSKKHFKDFIINNKIELGHYYVKQNQFDKALEQFADVLDHDPNNRIALLKAGSLYLDGKIQIDKMKALEKGLVFMEKAAEQYNETAAIIWHWYAKQTTFDCGAKMEADQKKALYFLEKAVKAGNLAAQRAFMRFTYLGELGLLKDKAKALKWYDDFIAKINDPGDIIDAGMLCFNDGDYARAYEYFSDERIKASQWHLSISLLHRAQMYYKGKYVTKDVPKSLDYIMMGLDLLDHEREPAIINNVLTSIRKLDLLKTVLELKKNSDFKIAKQANYIASRYYYLQVQEYYMTSEKREYTKEVEVMISIARTSLLNLLKLNDKDCIIGGNAMLADMELDYIMKSKIAPDRIFEQFCKVIEYVKGIIIDDGDYEIEDVTEILGLIVKLKTNWEFVHKVYQFTDVQYADLENKMDKMIQFIRSNKQIHSIIQKSTVLHFRLENEKE